MIRLAFICTMAASPLAAETVVATRTIPAQTVISADDIRIVGDPTGEALQEAQSIIGMEARVALFANRPIQSGNIGPPAVVERNEIIPLLFERNGLTISTDGRALGRAGPGDVIRVMNLGSRTTVTARIGSDGVAYVQR